MFVVLSAICICASAATYLPGYFRSDWFEIQKYGNFDEESVVVDVRYGYFANVAAVFAAAFQSFSALFMILSIDNIVSKLSRFSPFLENNKRSRKNKIFFIISCLLVLLVIILSATGFVVTGTFVIVFFSFLTSAYFLYSAVKFVKAINRLSATDNEIVKITTNLVTNTCFQISFGLILTSLLGVTYFFSALSFEEVLAPGDFNYILFIRNLTELTGLYLFTVTAWYINSVTEGPVLADQCFFLCCIFKVWDRKNKQLIPADTDILNTQQTTKADTTQIL